MHLLPGSGHQRPHGPPQCAGRGCHPVRAHLYSFSAPALLLMMLCRCSIKPVTIADSIISELLHKLNHPAGVITIESGREETPKRSGSSCVLLDGNGSANDEKRRLTVTKRSQPARSSRHRGVAGSCLKTWAQAVPAETESESERVYVLCSRCIFKAPNLQSASGYPMVCHMMQWASLPSSVLHFSNFVASA